jgi:hypothetical protein
MGDGEWRPGRLLSAYLVDHQARAEVILLA